ncbi:MAG: hypothetical protein II279_08960, partial [Bacteroidaceae bacterium]|nr:hypothetical protein [Bacteroidaceae bacterium]
VYATPAVYKAAGSFERKVRATSICSCAPLQLSVLRYRCSVCNAELEQYVIPQESGMSLQFIVMGDLGVIVAIVAGAAWSIHKKKVRKMGRMRSRVV